MFESICLVALLACFAVQSSVGNFVSPTSDSSHALTVIPPAALAIPTTSAVYHLELRKIDLDDAFKGKIKRPLSNDFKVFFYDYVKG